MTAYPAIPYGAPNIANSNGWRGMPMQAQYGYRQAPPMIPGYPPASMPLALPPGLEALAQSIPPEQLQQALQSREFQQQAAQITQMMQSGQLSPQNMQQLMGMAAQQALKPKNGGNPLMTFGLTLLSGYGLSQAIGYFFPLYEGGWMEKMLKKVESFKPIQDLNAYLNKKFPLTSTGSVPNYRSFGHLEGAYSHADSLEELYRSFIRDKGHLHEGLKKLGVKEALLEGLEHGASPEILLKNLNSPTVKNALLHPTDASLVKEGTQLYKRLLGLVIRAEKLEHNKEYLQGLHQTFKLAEKLNLGRVGRLLNGLFYRLKKSLVPGGWGSIFLLLTLGASISTLFKEPKESKKARFFDTLVSGVLGWISFDLALHLGRELRLLDRFPKLRGFYVKNIVGGAWLHKLSKPKWLANPIFKKQPLAWLAGVIGNLPKHLTITGGGLLFDFIIPMVIIGPLMGYAGKKITDFMFGNPEEIEKQLELKKLQQLQPAKPAGLFNELNKGRIPNKPGVMPLQATSTEDKSEWQTADLPSLEQIGASPVRQKEHLGALNLAASARHFNIWQAGQEH